MSDISEAASLKGTGNEPGPAVTASFSPIQTSSYASPRSTVIIHQKSPLLIATPPQVTRALAYSHPFLLPLDRLAGLLSWSTDDPWDSFLLLCSFWAIVLYGDVLILLGGPVLLVIGLMLGMYSRRFSPLSTFSQPSSGPNDHRRTTSTSSMSSSTFSSDATLVRHRKSLDDVVDTLNNLTMRCNTLLEPLLQLTDFLSTQYTATSASTRPSLVRLLARMLAVLPLWIALSLPSPVRLITARRVVFVVGTLVLTWHSKPARVSRTLLWRSRGVRRTCAILTGLHFARTEEPALTTNRGEGRPPPLPARRKSQRSDATSHLAAATGGGRVGVRFTFTLFENQRRWLGIGWTASLFAYERAAWTDEHLNACAGKDDFKLPHVEGAGAAWRWVEGSEWRVEPLDAEDGAGGAAAKGKEKWAPSTVSVRGKGGPDEGWVYYDNNWSGGRKADGWGRYTRRRKWVRDAELVEVPTVETGGGGHGDGVASGVSAQATELPAEEVEGPTKSNSKDDAGNEASIRKRKGFFTRRISKGSIGKASTKSGSTLDDDEGPRSPRRLNEEGEDERTLQRAQWEMNDDMKMGLG